MTRQKSHSPPRQRLGVKALKGRYRILREIGGGMTTVYRARDLKAGRGEPRIVALKVLRTADMDAEEQEQILAQFKKEGAILSILNHPNLPRVLDYFSSGAAHYLVMEFVDGQNLEDVLACRQGRPLEEKKALVYGIQLCRVVHYLGLQKPRPIVFRDLKPSNIMITPSGRVKLVDFGIARFIKEAKPQDTFVFGTPGYASPEQYGSGQTDQRSDIFSLGATLHHMLTGHPPPTSPFHFRPVLELNPHVSRKTSAVVMKALSPHREDRFQSASEMKAALYDALMGLDMNRNDSFIFRTTRALTRTGPQQVLPLNTIPTGPLSFIRRRISPRLFDMSLKDLGCATLKGEIRFDQKWIAARPPRFNEGSTSTLLEVNPSGFKPGRIYPARAIIHTNAGVFTPLLRFQVKPSILHWTMFFFSLFLLFLFII